MNAETSTPRGYDPIASLALALVASIALALAWLLPWWTMEARAPQYGQRTLVVEVSPVKVGGDIFEVDTLGHYVGIRPMGELASFERILAPFGLVAAVLGVLAAPFLRRRWLRGLAILPAVVMPIFFVFDLRYWMDRATNERDPDASMNLTVTAIDTKILGEYEIAQFKVTAKLGGGIFVGGIAGLLAVGMLFSSPLPLRRRRPANAAAAGAIAGMFLLAPGSSEAAELQVGPEDLLHDALVWAQPGDVIRVRGVHRERVVVPRSVRIYGEPGAVLDGGGEGTVLRILAADVVVQDLTIRNSGTNYNQEDAGVRIEAAPGVVLRRVRIEDTLFGLFALQADRCVLEDSKVIGFDLPVERRGDGVRLWASAGCRLLRNHVERSRDVIIWYSADTVVEANVVRTSRYGLHYMYSDRNRFHHNVFEDNQVGAAIMYSRDLELTENAFSFSTGPSAVGLLLKDADDVFIRRNRFVGNATGLFLDNAPQARDGRLEIQGNWIARNDVGIALQPNVRRARVWENAFVGNRAQVEVQGTGSAEGNEWAVEGRGNYWSDAIVYDPDGDGVSSLPARQESTYEIMAERHPVLGFYADTPAAEAIDLAARWFPIFQPRPRLVDPHPLVKAPTDAWSVTTAHPAERGGLLGLGALLLATGAGTYWSSRRALG